MQIRTVVVDDEPLARSRIMNRLKEHEEIKLIGECRNGKEAVRFINDKKPALIFLDIQMPDMDGFAVISKLNLEYDPFIIFATAYDQYALKAFDVHAIDYLLKPFDNERFNEALARAKTQIKLQKSSYFNEKLLGLIKEYQQDYGDYKSAFTIKKDGRKIKIDVEHIFWLEATGNYITLHLAERKFLYRGTMNAIEADLNPQFFLRIHRSFIVNTLFVEKIRYISGNEYKVVLKNGQELISGRSYKEKIVAYLESR